MSPSTAPNGSPWPASAKPGRGKFGGGRRPYGFESDGITVIANEAAVIVRMAVAVMAGVPLRSAGRSANYVQATGSLTGTASAHRPASTWASCAVDHGAGFAELCRLV